MILIAVCLSCSPSVKAAKEPRDFIELLKSNEIKLTNEIKRLNEMHRADRKRLVSRIVELEGSGSNVEFSVITSNHDVSSEKYFDTGAGLTNNKSIEIIRYQEYLDNASSGYIAKYLEENIDFKSSQVVLLNMGTQSSGGYKIVAESVVDFGDHIKLNVLSSEPGEGCVVNLWLTQPFQLLKIISRKKLIIHERYEKTPCVKSINKKVKRR